MTVDPGNGRFAPSLHEPEQIGEGTSLGVASESIVDKTTRKITASTECPVALTGIDDHSDLVVFDSPTGGIEQTLHRGGRHRVVTFGIVDRYRRPPA
jgi:hypothetical protein